MQTRKLPLALLLSLLLSGNARSQQTNAPVMPVGTLSAFPTIVQAGTHPQLTWNVTLPAAVLDVVTSTSPGTGECGRVDQSDDRFQWWHDNDGGIQRGTDRSEGHLGQKSFQCEPALCRRYDSKIRRLDRQNGNFPRHGLQLRQGHRRCLDQIGQQLQPDLRRSFGCRHLALERLIRSPPPPPPSPPFGTS